MEHVATLQYAKDETTYDEFDRRRLECLLIEHHHQAEKLADYFYTEIADAEAAEWLALGDECEYFNYRITISGLCYRSLLEQLRLVVQQKNQLVREGFWLSKANVTYQERIRQLDTRLGLVRQAIRPLGFSAVL